jgi:hypothetical protein
MKQWKNQRDVWKNMDIKLRGSMEEKSLNDCVFNGILEILELNFSKSLDKSDFIRYNNIRIKVISADQYAGYKWLG